MDAQQIIETVSQEYVRDEYAMYLRKSRADIELEAISHEETLARHKDMLYQLAERNNITTDQITVYHEIVSGDSIEDRPEVQRLLDDVYAKKYKGVLVVEVERLARGNTKDQGEVAEAFQYSHTHIITPAKTYDPDNEYDQEYFEFGLFMSRREYKTIRRRLSAGKLAAVKEGNYIGSAPPYGYDAERRSKKERVLVQKPDEANVVRMIFDWYTEENRTFGWISRRLNEMGIPSKTKKEWKQDSIRKIMRNYHYIGLVTWNRRIVSRVKDTESGKTLQKRVPGSFDLYEGKHEGIISKEQFEKAQDITERKSTPVKNGFAITNPWATLIVCADCGKPIQILRDLKKGRKTHVDRFRHHPGSFACQKKSLPVDQVTEALIEGLKAYIADFEIKLTQDTAKEDSVKHEEAISLMEKELAKQERLLNRLFDSWENEDGMYTKDEFITRKKMYAQKIEALKEKIAEMKKHVPVQVDYEEKIFHLHQVIDCVNDKSISGKDKNDFLKQYIEKITYDVIDYGVGKGGKPILDIRLK